MNINIKGTELALTPSIKTFAESKIGALSKFVKEYEEEGSVEVQLELGRTTRHHRHGDVFKAEANMVIPGKTLRAEDESDDLRVAIDNVRNKLKLELEKYKTKKEKPKARARKSS